LAFRSIGTFDTMGDSFLGKIGVSNVFMRLRDAHTKITVLEGGSGSSKTYSIIQFIILYLHAHQGEGKRVLIVRQKLTWLKLSVVVDFFNVLRNFGIEDPDAYNKTEGVLSLFGNYVYFTGLDEPQKVHGPRWDGFWGNEAIELGYDDCRQVVMRTNDFVIYDYNPSLTDHWIYNRIIPRDDCTFILSTQLDNPFLPAEQRKEILAYEPIPKNIANGTADVVYWDIYGLGKRANIEGVIFPFVNYCEKFPQYCRWIVYGLDFGYVNHPTALVRVGLYEGELYLEELIYETKLVNIPIPDKDGEVAPNIHDKMIELGLRQEWDELYADKAEDKSIRELQLKGWAVVGARKGPDSIVNGIDILKRYKLNITESSLNFRKEQQNYKWLINPIDKQGQSYINKPADSYNHLWDATRYAVLMKIGEPSDFYMEALN